MAEEHARLQLTITAINHKGFGVARHNGRVVFVPATVPGDIILAQVVNRQKSHWFAVPEQVLRPAEGRIAIDCPAYPACGGCSLRQMDYRVECQQKEQLVLQNFKKIGHVECQADPMITAPKQIRYRNKVQLPIQQLNGKIHWGFFAAKSHRLIPLIDCLLQPELFSRIANWFCQFLEEQHIPPYCEDTHTGLVRHLCLRSSADQKQVMAVVVINGSALPYVNELVQGMVAEFSEITTIVLNHNNKVTNVVLGEHETVLYGSGEIVDTLCGVSLGLSSSSFYQVNHAATTLLYKKAQEYAQLQPNDRLLDLYCGIGSIGLALVAEAGQLVGVEIVPQAVKNAKANAVRNHNHTARFIQGDSGKAATELVRTGLQPNVVVVDPPRKGLDARAIMAVVAMTPNRVVYISCNSATLARDLAIFGEQGYMLQRACVVDLFPRTPHVEVVVLLEQKLG